MNDKIVDQEAHRTFQLMTELEASQAVSQRELAGRLGIAVGLVNSYLKNLVSKGFVRVKIFPRNRYAYLLTPKGIAEKSRLAYQHLNYFTSLYTVTRQDYLALFRSLERKGVQDIAFCGVDEVAEIAYLSLRETGLKLGDVMDNERSGEVFFDRTILSLEEGVRSSPACVVLTSLKKGLVLQEELLRLGTESFTIHGGSVVTR